MSRIFDALQRSEAERSGVVSERPFSLATELLEFAEREVPAPVEDQAEESPVLTISAAPEGRICCLVEKDGLCSEKFRFLGVRVRQFQQAKSIKKLLVTSTIPQEGKSFVCSNLAVTLARKKNQRVLLIEGDLRRPVLAKRFGVGELAGLSEWLQTGNGAHPTPNIYRLDAADLWFVPAGGTPEHPLELLQGGKLSELLTRLSDQFDLIIIDSPPILPLADTSVLARMSDGILLVTREGITEKRQLEKGLQALDQAKLLGVVINSSEGGAEEQYYRHYGPKESSSSTVEGNS